MLIVGLVALTIVLALVSPVTLEWLAADRVVARDQGGRMVDPQVVLEGPLDQLTQGILFAGAYLSIVAFVLILRRGRRSEPFWLIYGLALALSGLEEAEWLAWFNGGLPFNVSGLRIGALHDFVHKYILTMRLEHELGLPAIPGLVLISIGASVAFVWAIRRDIRLLGGGLKLLVVIGALLGSLGIVVDSGYIPLFARFGSMDLLLEEPLEAIGAICLAIVAAEGACGAIAWRLDVKEDRAPAAAASASGVPS
jgi:hypothetical protein